MTAIAKFKKQGYDFFLIRNISHSTNNRKKLIYNGGIFL